MLRKKAGHVVSISSILGLVGAAQMSQSVDLLALCILTISGLLCEQSCISKLASIAPL